MDLLSQLCECHTRAEQFFSVPNVEVERILFKGDATTIFTVCLSKLKIYIVVSIFIKRRNSIYI